jgi:hypothetical protein
MMRGEIFRVVTGLRGINRAIVGKLQLFCSAQPAFNILAKHKVGGSIPLTRSIFKPSGNRGLFYFSVFLRRAAAPVDDRRA